AMNFLAAEPGAEGLRLPQLGLALRRPHAPSTRPCVAGLRPEHLVEASRAAANACRFDARLVRLEWLGSDAYAQVEPALDSSPEIAAAGGAMPGPLIARLDAGAAPREGERLTLAFDPARL